MLAIGVCLYFAFGVVSSAIAVMVGPIRAELDLSYGQMGVILGSWQLVYIVAAIPLGIAIDRLGLKRSLAIGGVVIAASAGARAAAGSFLPMVAAVGLFGVGGPIVSIGLPKLVATWFAPGDRTFPTAVYVTGAALGAAAGLAATNTLVVPLVGGWRSAYAAYGVFALGVALTWMLAGREPRSPAVADGAPPEVSERAVPEGAGDAAAQPEDRFGQVIDVLRAPRVLLAAAVGVSGFMIVHGLNNWLPEILIAKGYEIADAGALATVPRLGGIFGALIAARLSGLLGSRLAAVAAVLTTSAAALTLVAAVHGAWALGAILALLGVAAAGVMPLMTALVMDLPEVGAKRIGAAAGAYFAVGEIGGFGGPALMGWLHDLTASFVPGLAAMSAFALLSLAPLVILGRALRRR